MNFLFSFFVCFFFVLFWEKKKRGGGERKKHYQITTGTNFAKDTGVSAKKGGNGQYITYNIVRMSNQQESEKEQKKGWNERNERERERKKHMQY